MAEIEQPMQSSPKAANPPRITAIDPALFALHNGSHYRTPLDLQVTPDSPLRFLAVGGCFAEPLPEVAAIINRSFQGDFILLNNFDSFPEISPERVARYDFQIIHPPLRTILGNAFFRLPDDGSQHESFLRQTEDYLSRYLSSVLALNSRHKLLTFVLGFLVPQQNPLGRFAPRYDLRNIVHFVERLNMFLAAEIAKRENTHFVDIDLISASMGKKSCQDDSVWSFTHGTTLSDGDHDHDLSRIQPPASMQQHYSAQWLEFFQALLHEVFAMHRTLKPQDPVKLVAVDLDDTLWRGIAADGTLGILEGWPLGFIETLLCLKKRGILLAIVSKNDERFIKSNWDKILHGHISLTDFAACKINFRPKAENLTELLDELSLLPRNAVMIDDNPVERAAIQAGLPGVRVLGSHPYYLKRVLLWSPQTQQPVATGESGRKTSMVQAQLRRESARQELPQHEFLQSLDLRVSVTVLHGTTDLHMGRALELFNKTNQFNTTGARYTLEHCHQHFLAGRQLFVLDAQDRFTNYGLVAAAWACEARIEHLVMSCRALGLGIEDAFLACLANEFVQLGATRMLGLLLRTEANIACRDLYSRNGFTAAEDDPALWARPLALPFPTPAHIRLNVPGGTGVASTGNPAPAAPADYPRPTPARKDRISLPRVGLDIPASRAFQRRRPVPEHVLLHS